MISSIFYSSISSLNFSLIQKIKKLPYYSYKLVLISSIFYSSISSLNFSLSSYKIIIKNIIFAISLLDCFPINLVFERVQICFDLAFICRFSLFLLVSCLAQKFFFGPPYTCFINHLLYLLIMIKYLFMFSLTHMRWKVSFLISYFKFHN